MLDSPVQSSAPADVVVRALVPPARPRRAARGVIARRDPMTESSPRDTRLFDELQRMAARLRDLERDLEHSRLLLSSAPDAIIVADADGRITSWNAAADALYGWSAAEMLGRRLDERRPGPARPAMQDVLHSLRDGRELVGEREDFRRDGSRLWIDVRLRGVLDSHGRVLAIVEIARDVTGRRQAEQDRRAGDARALQVKKLESLGVLAGGVAHDFNNLLTSVLGNTDLALAHLPPSSPARPHLKHIEYAAQRAAELARQMLAYSGRGQFVVRPIRLDDVVRARLDLIRSLLRAHVALETTLAADRLQIDGDADQIAQLLMNVVVNAIEAIGEAPGTVSLATGNGFYTREDLAGTYLDEHQPEGEYAWLDIADTGCGIAPDVQARMFEPFFSTKFTGRGLGLSAALGILRGHGGAVRVTSEAGRGTLIRLLFPTRPQPRPSGSDASGTRVTPSGTGPPTNGRILVIDDEETVRSVARMILERAGFGVVTAASGPEGIARFREAEGGFAAVLLDMRLPIVTSREVCEALVLIRPDVRVILSSGYLEDDAVEGFDRRCISGYLQKPYRFDELVACIRRVAGLGPSEGGATPVQS